MHIIVSVNIVGNDGMGRNNFIWNIIYSKQKYTTTQKLMCYYQYLIVWWHTTAINKTRQGGQIGMFLLCYSGTYCVAYSLYIVVFKSNPLSLTLTNHVVWNVYMVNTSELCRQLLSNFNCTLLPWQNSLSWNSKRFFCILCSIVSYFFSLDSTPF